MVTRSQVTAPTAVSEPREGQIPALARDRLGAALREMYLLVLEEPQPHALLDLATRLGQVLEDQHSATATAFRDGLLSALPGLRAFALTLALNHARADDLVQETLLKAWSNQHRFQQGTNLMAWLCTIMRNQFYTEIRKRKREVEDADGVLAGQLMVPAAQESASDLRTLWSRMAKLPPAQREALVLVGAQGMTYEAAAEFAGCQVGTVKSRVSRARDALTAAPR